MAVVNTTLDVGLVSVPVSLNKLAERADVELDTASADGHALAQTYLDSVTGEVAPRDTWQKGVFEQKPKDRTQWDGFRVIPKDSLDAIDAETKIDSFSIEGFIPLAEVPFERAVGCYYLTPQKGAPPRALKVLYEALRKSKKAGVFKLTLRSRQQPAVVYAKNGGLFVNTLVFSEDFSKVGHAGEALAQVESDPAMVTMAVDLIEQLTTDATVLDSLTDDVRPLKAKLVEEALAGKPLSKKAKAAPAPKPDSGLADMLAASVENVKKQKGAKAPSRAPVAAR